MKRRHLLASVPALGAASAIAAPAAASVPVSPWRPIETAPKSDASRIHYILIGDGLCLPDLVTWKGVRPAYTDRHGTRYAERSAGWFGVNGGRSRITNPTVWAPVPDYGA